MPAVNRRAHYRIVYPETERPRLVVGSRICEVLDCSERGVRFSPLPRQALGAGIEVEGRLRFPRGEEVRVRGAVVRLDGAVALRLVGGGIPFGTILQEQLYLRRRARSGRAAALAPG